MTFQPPPPPPPAGPPPPPGGPPPGQWGPPAGNQPQGQWGPPPGGGQYRPAPAGFNPKTINPLDWGILAAGALAFVFSFVSYYTYSVKGFGSLGTGHWNAWHGFFGWFAMLCAVIGSVAVGLAIFAPQVKLPVPNRLVGLGAYALATLCVILALFLVPTPGGIGGSELNKGHGFGYWISLIVILAGLVLSLMRLQQSGGKLPGALSKMPNIGGRGPGGPPSGGPGGPPSGGPGYGPPPGGPGYGPPPGGPGYGPPPGGPGYGPPTQ